ncbi:hypothetical protein ACF3M2_13865 [Tissierella carlieri]|uniref:hypothetical protein n=1 Tax=Tissierella TaxID=41273 RepID=UPI003026FFCF
MEGRKERTDITLEDVDKSYNRFMKLLEEKEYNAEAGDDELDEDIIKDVLTNLKEDEKGRQLHGK